MHAFNGNSNNLVNTNSGNSTNATANVTNTNQANSNQNNSSNQSNNNSMLGSDINTTAAYLWLLSQQQQQQQNNSNRNSSSSNGLLNGDLISPSNTNHNNLTTNGSSITNNALSALNLTRSLSSLASAAANNSTNSTNQQTSTNNETNSKTTNQLDESTDEEDDLNDDEMDDSELRSSHSNLSNSIDNHQPNLFNGFKENRTETPTNSEQLNSNNQMNNLLRPTLLSNNKENDVTSNKETNKEQLPFGQLGLSNLINNDDLFRGLNRSNNSDLKNGNALVHSQNISSIGNSLTTNTDSLESLLRNIENLVSIAVQNARQQQQQLNLHKGKQICSQKYFNLRSLSKVTSNNFE